MKKIDKNVIENKILISFIQGYLDPSPHFREATIESTVLFIESLSSSMLAKCQADSISSYLSPDILVIAVCRGLKDSFNLSRTASLKTIQSTIDRYDLKHISCQLLPNICLLLSDPDSNIREITISLIKSLVNQSEILIKNIPTNVEESTKNEKPSKEAFFTKFFSFQNIQDQQQPQPSVSLPNPTNEPNINDLNQIEPEEIYDWEDETTAVDEWPETKDIDSNKKVTSPENWDWTDEW